jgi:hypothetical protein
MQQAADVALHAREIQLALIGRHEKCHFVRGDQPVRRYLVADRLQDGGSCDTIRFCTRRLKGASTNSLTQEITRRDGRTIRFGSSTDDLLADPVESCRQMSLNDNVLALAQPNIYHFCSSWCWLPVEACTKCGDWLPPTAHSSEKEFWAACGRNHRPDPFPFPVV